MKQSIINFPNQFIQLLGQKAPPLKKGCFDKVIISGMGGSAWPAEIVTAWLNPPFPMIVNRSYHLPSQSDKNSLMIFISYSGNTEECLSSYREAVKKGLSSIAITSGGRLKEECFNNQTPLIEIPNGLVPRMATGYIFTSLYNILKESGLTKNRNQEIETMADQLKDIIPAQEKTGEGLAEKMFQKVILIYASKKMKVLSYIWKIKINENAKIPAFSNFFPEINHNEMEGMSHREEYPCAKAKESLFFALTIKDEEDEPQIKKRMELTEKILKNKGLSAETIDLTGRNRLTKIFSNVVLADWASYYLALKYGEDPLKTEAIESFKEKMK